MKRPLLSIFASLGFFTASNVMATACPWASGAYDFKENGIYGEFDVNGDCTQMVWKRLQEPETTALKKTKDGWRGELTKVDVVLLENGHSIRIFDGGIMRQTLVKPKG